MCQMGTPKLRKALKFTREKKKVCPHLPYFCLPESDCGDRVCPVVILGCLFI